MSKAKRKIDRKCDARMHAYVETMKGSREAKVNLRIRNGGFHAPGSRQRRQQQ